jgi:protein-tyrosine phosphatase
MIDLHSHILPALDDGANDASETLALLKLAVADGITRMVATPHINPGYFDNTKESISQALALTRQLINQAQLPIAISAAAEVRLTDQLMPAIEQQTVPFIGSWQGQQVLLLELPHSHVPAGTDLLLKWLAKKDIIAMIAHPERNRDVQANPAVLNPLRRVGCLFQLTASSLLGDLGDRHQQCAEHFVQQRLFHIVATDCHNIQRRPPKLSAAVQRLTELTDEEYALNMSQLMPAQISASLDFSL